MVLDFDGTLVDSNPIKMRGFEAVFADFPERLPKIMAYCQGGPETPRGQKFKHVYEVILGRALTAAARKRLEEKFAEATTEAIVRAGEIPGAGAFLRRAAKRYLTTLLSTTPHDILLEIIARRGWRRYFSVVRGAPVNKAEWLRLFLVQHSLEPSEVIFFGDALEDADAAAAAKCGFIGVGAAAFAGLGLPFIKDFTGIDL